MCPTKKPPSKKLAACKTPTKKDISQSSPNAAASFGSDYLARFHAMVDELRSDPEIRIHQLFINPPASPVDLAAVEKHLGVPLAPAVRSFYEATDGLQLRWIHARHRDIADEKAGPLGGQRLAAKDILFGGQIHHGMINILPVRKTFLDALDWGWSAHAEDEDPVRFDGKVMPSRDFYKSLHLFDVYYFYECVALYVRPGVCNPPVLFGTDHGADWSDAFEDKEHASFEDYLDSVLAQRGLIEDREVHPRSYWDHHRLPLKKLLGRLELTPKASNNANATDLLKRLKKKNKDTLALLSDAELAKFGANREEVIAIVRAQLPDWPAIGALYRLDAFTERDIPMLEGAAREKSDAAFEALARLGETSDVAVQVLLELLERQIEAVMEEIRARENIYAELLEDDFPSLKALGRLGARAAATWPCIFNFIEKRVAEDKLREPDLRPWLLAVVHLAVSGVSTGSAVPLLQKVELLTRPDAGDYFSRSAALHRLAVAGMVASVPALRDQYPTWIDDLYKGGYGGDTRKLNEAEVLLSFWPVVAEDPKRYLPLVEGFLLDFADDVDTFQFGTRLRVEVLDLTGRLLNALRTLDVAEVRASVDRIATRRKGRGKDDGFLAPLRDSLPS